MKVEKKKMKKIIEAVDTFFIMFLCFAVLFTTMTINGISSNGIKYKISIPSFMITIALLVFYLLFVVFQSEKGLKEIFKICYVDEDQTTEKDA